MSASKQHVEQDVQDVLASIREIIQEDDENLQKDAEIIEFEQHATEKAVARLSSLNEKQGINKDVLREEDIFNLTEFVTSRGEIIHLDTGEAIMAKKDDSAAEEILEAEEVEAKEAEGEELDMEAAMEGNDAGDAAEAANEDEEIVELDTPLEEEGAANTNEGEPILSDKAASEAAEAFLELDAVNESLKKSIQNGEFGQKTMDDLLKEMLRPLLKAWLDANLPSLVKWLVTEQIEKVMKEQKRK